MSTPTPPARFLVKFKMTAWEEYTAPTAADALADAENSESPNLQDFTSDEGPEIVAQWDPAVEEWRDIPTPPALRSFSLAEISTHLLIMELHRRQDALALPPSIEPCLLLAVTPSDLSEFWECDESGATHPGSRVPEPSEWPTIRRAFERWQDCGSFSDLMETLRDAWQAEQARQLDKEGGSK